MRRRPFLPALRLLSQQLDFEPYLRAIRGSDRSSLWRRTKPSVVAIEGAKCLFQKPRQARVIGDLNCEMSSSECQPLGRTALAGCVRKGTFCETRETTEARIPPDRELHSVCRPNGT